MVHISVAEGAALINVTIVTRTRSIHESTRDACEADRHLVILTFPLLVTIVVIGTLKDTVNAATW